MNLSQVVFSNLTHKLLETCGIQDRKNGIDRYEGWRRLCDDLGWQDEGRTPAREAYEDGYYKPLEENDGQKVPRR